MCRNQDQTTYLSSEWANSPSQVISLMSLSLIVEVQNPTQPWLPVKSRITQLIPGEVLGRPPPSPSAGVFYRCLLAFALM